MPTKLSVISEGVARCAVEVGKHIRTQRKALGVSVTTAAEAAGMSRVTWFRIEKGTTSVTLGAYLSALNVLNLELKIIQQSQRNDNSTTPPDASASIPVRIAFADYPQLKQLAWQLHGIDELSPREALSVYERNWRHLDEAALEPHEHNLIAALRQVFHDE